MDKQMTGPELNTIYKLSPEFVLFLGRQSPFSMDL